MRAGIVHPRLVQAAAAVLLIALCTAGLVAANTEESDTTGLQVKAADEPEQPANETTTTTEQPSTTTEAAPTTAAAATPSTVAPVPAKPREPRAARPASATSDTMSATLGPRPPGSAVFPFEPGRTSWSATSNGVNLSLTIDKATPRTGELVTFTMSASMSDRPCCDLSMVFGDGGIAQSDSAYCGYGNTRPTAMSATKSVTHIYNKTGKWEFLFSASSMTCGDNTAYGSIYAWVEVVAGSTTSQGPSQPTIRVGRYAPAPHSDDPSHVTVYGRARDEDGYIAKLVVDYGDGATEEFPGDGAGCRQSLGGWPSASTAWTPTDPPPTHNYAAQGTYTVTVTAYSQGCDSREVQTVSGSFDRVY